MLASHQVAVNSKGPGRGRERLGKEEYLLSLSPSSSRSSNNNKNLQGRLGEAGLVDLHLVERGQSSKRNRPPSGKVPATIQINSSNTANTADKTNLGLVSLRTTTPTHKMIILRKRRKVKGTQ